MTDPKLTPIHEYLRRIGTDLADHAYALHKTGPTDPSHLLAYGVAIASVFRSCQEFSAIYHARQADERLADDHMHDGPKDPQ